MLSRQWKAFLGFSVAALCLVLLWSFLGSLFDSHREQSAKSPSLEQESKVGPSPKSLAEVNSELVRERLDGYAALSKEGMLHITVQDASGHPAEQLTLLLLEENGHFLNRAQTDSNGVAIFAPLLTTAQILCLSGTALLLKEELLEGEGRHILTLPGNAALAGRVLVDGAKPTEILQLSFTTKLQGDVSPPPWQVPGPAAEALEWRPGQSPMLAVSTDASGAFRIPGLSPTWQGALILPHGYRFANHHAFTNALRTTEDLLLPLTHSPGITGRVVTPDGVSPCPGAFLAFSLRGNAAVNQGTVTADGEGRFFIEININSVQNAHLELRSPGIGYRALDLGALSSKGKELGDITLETARDLPLLILDTKGNPIEGAVARFGWKKSPPTNAGGLSLMTDLPFSARELDIHALGYRQKKTALLSDSQDRVEVQLDPLARLQIQVLDPNGHPIPGAELLLRSTTAPFINGQSAPPQEQQELGAPTNQGAKIKKQSTKGTGSSEVSFYMTDSPLFLPGIQPGIELTLTLRDGTGKSVKDLAIPPLTKGESRVVNLHAPSIAHWQHLQVVDTHNQGIPGALVELAGLPIGRRWHETTNGYGMLALGPLFADNLALKVSADGFGDRVLLNWNPMPNKQENTIRLSGAKRIDVFVQDSEGQPLADVRLHIEQGPFQVGGVHPMGVGHFQVEGLDLATVNLVTGIAEQEFTQSHSTFSSQAVVQIPAFASLKVVWEEYLPIGRAFLELIDEEGKRGPFQSMPKAASAREPGSFFFPVVFPGLWKVQMWLYDLDGNQIGIWSAASPVRIQAGGEQVVKLLPPSC